MFKSPFTINMAGEFMSSALNARAVRQDMISSNIANVDTPYYRPRDISFEDVLKKEANKTYGIKEPILEMAKTSSSHLEGMDSGGRPQPTMFYRDGHMARNDGNSVDLDVEMSEMNKNSTVYNALVNAYKKNTAIFSSVIDASKNVQ
jgi:flagellar basal-body rod protein FlgB